MRLLAFAAFCATVPAANWLIGNAGTVCIPNGPCLIPVGFGLMAPSGVLVIGLALVLRDWLHEMAGRAWVLVAIVAGAALSGLVAPGALVLASAAAFLVSEVSDFAVYARVRRRSVALAMLLSGALGAVVDSMLFLWLAFESLDHVGGQILGKLYASVAVAGVLSMRRARAAA